MGLLYERWKGGNCEHSRSTLFWPSALFCESCLPLPPYSPGLAPSDYHLFGPVEEGLRGKHYASNEEVKTVLKKWLKEQWTEIYETGIHALIWRWGIAIERNSDYVEK